MPANTICSPNTTQGAFARASNSEKTSLAGAPLQPGSQRRIDPPPAVDAATESVRLHAPALSDAPSDAKRRNPLPFAAIPYALLEDRRLTGHDVRIAGLLLKWFQGNPSGWVLNAKLVEDSGLKIRAVQQALQRLKKTGWFRDEKTTHKSQRRITAVWMMEGTQIANAKGAPSCTPGAHRDASQGRTVMRPKESILKEISERAHTPTPPEVCVRASDACDSETEDALPTYPVIGPSIAELAKLVLAIVPPPQGPELARKLRLKGNELTVQLKGRHDFWRAALDVLVMKEPGAVHSPYNFVTSLALGYVAKGGTSGYTSARDLKTPTPPVEPLQQPQVPATDDAERVRRDIFEGRPGLEEAIERGRMEKARRQEARRRTDTQRAIPQASTMSKVAGGTVDSSTRRR